MRSLILSVPLVTLSALAAQNVVSPAHFSNVEAPSYAYTPIGDQTVPSRYLQVFDDLTSPMNITGFSLRRDYSAGGRTAWGAYTILCNIWCSNAIVNAGTVNRTFDLNHGTNKAQVRNQFSPINIAAQTWSPPVMGFDTVIPFSQPFAWNGSGSLAIEIGMTQSTLSGTRYFDYVSGTSTNPAPEYLSFGVGCKTTGTTTTMVLNPSASMNWTTKVVQLNYSGSSMPRSALAYLMLGFSRTNWGPLPLPFELPGTAASPSGPCTAYVSGDIIVPVLTTATGTFSQTLQVNNIDTNLHGLNLYSEAVGIDQAANNWGIVASNATQHHIVAPWNVMPVGNVYLQNSNGALGTAQPRAGYIVKFN
jgi:hypothetical protein